MANIITCIRIICALSLIFCPTFSAPFFAIYILGGISDVLDGIAARKLGKETKFGAQLDTAADIVFTAVVIIKVLCGVDVPLRLIIWTVLIAAVKCPALIGGFIIYRRFLSEHTVLNKICGVLLFAAPLYIGLLPRQVTAVAVILSYIVATAAAVQEAYYIFTGKEIE